MMKFDSTFKSRLPIICNFSSFSLLVFVHLLCATKASQQSDSCTSCTTRPNRCANNQIDPCSNQTKLTASYKMFFPFLMHKYMRNYNFPFILSLKFHLIYSCVPLLEQLPSLQNKLHHDRRPCLLISHILIEIPKLKL